MTAPDSPAGDGRPLRIAWDSGSVDVNRTGSGAYAQHLFAALTARPGIEMVLLRPGWPVPTGRSWPARVIRTSSMLLWTHILLPPLVYFSGADIVHSPANTAPWFDPFECPLVVTVHDIMFADHPEAAVGWWAAYMGRLMPRVIRRARHVITVSQNSRADIVARYPAAEGRISVVANGVDHERFRPPTPGSWVRAQAAEADQYVLCVGEIVPRKNLELIGEAVALLRSARQWRGSLKVVGTGQPKYVNSLRQRFRDLGLGDVVQFTGHVSPRELSDLYRQATAFAFASRYEGFGLPLLEAMSAGTPVVALARSSVPEVTGNAALLIQDDSPAAFADGLWTIISRPARADELSGAGLRQAAAFTWDGAAERTALIYLAVASRPGRELHH